jgi:hypothetical protein
LLNPAFELESWHCVSELDEAFKLIKNQIGLRWKELARCLPYHPPRDLHDIDADIKEIEYENQGQLKEQVRRGTNQWGKQKATNSIYGYDSI